MHERAEAAKAQDEGEAARNARRMNIERRMDEILDQSFPASDPPAWGSVAARIEQETSIGR